MNSSCLSGIALMLFFFINGPVRAQHPVKASGGDQLSIVETDSVTEGRFGAANRSVRARIVPPKLTADESGCEGPCIMQIIFSDPAIKPISVDSSIGGRLMNLGDLNGDGKDELGIQTDWFQGCWRSYFVFTNENGVWVRALPPIPTHCNQWEAGINPVEKDPKGNKRVIVHYSTFRNNKIVVASKVEQIK
jgi:hypothetical protein